MNEVPKLTVGFSALAERVGDISIPEFSIPVEILISIQNPNQVKYSLPTSSFPIRVIESQETGVAKSRNVALQHSNTEYLIFADDDAKVLPKGIEEIITYFDSHPKCDLVTAMATDGNGNLRKSYPTKETKLHLFNSAKVGTIEMMVRIAEVKKKGIVFDQNFGAGSRNPVGDEYVFISDLLKADGKGVFLPIVIASHPANSSGHGSSNDENLMARAKVFSRVFGAWAPVIRTFYYLRRRKETFHTVEFLRFIRG